jgi:hypothetical protein
MKSLSILFILFFFVIGGVIHAQYDMKPRYQKKIKEYKSMRTRGIVLLSIGAPIAALGTTLIIQGNNELNSIDRNDPSYSRSDEEPGENKVAGGMILTGLSVLFVVPGTILTAVGAIKTKEYKKLLDNFSLGVICTPKEKGLSMVYRF